MAGGTGTRGESRTLTRKKREFGMTVCGVGPYQAREGKRDWRCVEDEEKKKERI